MTWLLPVRCDTCDTIDNATRDHRGAGAGINLPLGWTESRPPSGEAATHNCKTCSGRTELIEPPPEKKRRTR